MTTIYKPSFKLFEQHRKILIAGNENFTTKKTTYTAEIITANRRLFFFDELLKIQSLGYITKLRSEILKQAGNRKPFTAEREIEYCVYNYPELQNGTTLMNCIEIDINAAYLVTALQLGFISEDTFLSIKKMDKLQRLKILGSIATRKWIQQYINGRIVKEHEQTNDFLRCAWFEICARVDKVLIECKRLIGKSFLFYYVDGIYLMPRNFTDIDTVCNVISAHGYDWKTRPVHIHVTKKGNLIVWDGETKRPFYVRKKEVKKNVFLHENLNV